MTLHPEILGLIAHIANTPRGKRMADGIVFHERMEMARQQQMQSVLVDGRRIVRLPGGERAFVTAKNGEIVKIEKVAR